MKATCRAYTDREMIMNKLAEFFGADLRGRLKSLYWYNANNPLLGGVSPKHMVQSGRGLKLLRFIEQQLSGEI